MAEGLLGVLQRIEALAGKIRERETSLDEEIRHAHELGASMRQVATWAGVSPATISRRLNPRLTPEESEALVEQRRELRELELAIAKVRLQRAALAAGEEIDPDQIGDVDELIEEGLRIVDDLDL
jgi:hypothetical protein